MRIVAVILILVGVLLIAIGRHHVRRARQLSTKRRSAGGWSLTMLGFLTMLAGVVLW